MRTYVSAAASPTDRGSRFGTVHRAEIARTLQHYQELFDRAAGTHVDLHEVGRVALDAIGDYSSDAAAEIDGMAHGAQVPSTHLAALNARTEVLAQLDAATRGECSTVVALMPDGSVTTVQTWDWHDLLAGDWLVWTIEHPDGTVVHTVTEYGILGKIGVNNRGVGVHFNILHHETDGAGIGVPVHVLARTILDSSRELGDALSLAGAAQTSASTVLTLVGADSHGASALCAELSPVGPRFVLPSVDGLLLHTNHFLDPVLAAQDREPRIGPDSFLRLDVLRRALGGLDRFDRDSIVAAMSSHMGAGGALCCHARDDAELGDRWTTLVTVSLDVRAGTLSVRPGGPCNTDAVWDRPRAITSEPIGELV